MGKAPGRLFEWPNQVEPPDREGPRERDHLECLGREVSLPIIVLTAFVGAYNLLGIGYCGGPVETLSERIPNQGSWCSVMATCSTVDVAQQEFSLFARDIELQNSDVTSFVEFALYKNKGLGASCEPSGFRLVGR